MQRNTRICSLSVRIICETLILLVLFVPLLLFIFKWPNVENLIQSKILTVNKYKKLKKKENKNKNILENTFSSFI